MGTFFLGAAAVGLSLLKIATADNWTDAILVDYKLQAMHHCNFVDDSPMTSSAKLQ